jgi:hypothetical protein
VVNPLDTSFFDPILESPFISGMVVGLVAAIIYVLKQLIWPKEKMHSTKNDEEEP